MSMGEGGKMTIRNVEFKKCKASHGGAVHLTLISKPSLLLFESITYASMNNTATAGLPYGHTMFIYTHRLSYVLSSHLDAFVTESALWNSEVKVQVKDHHPITLAKLREVSMELSRITVYVSENGDDNNLCFDPEIECKSIAGGLLRGRELESEGSCPDILLAMRGGSEHSAESCRVIVEGSGRVEVSGVVESETEFVKKRVSAIHDDGSQSITYGSYSMSEEEEEESGGLFELRGSESELSIAQMWFILTKVNRIERVLIEVSSGIATLKTVRISGEDDSEGIDINQGLILFEHNSSIHITGMDIWKVNMNGWDGGAICGKDLDGGEIELKTGNLSECRCLNGNGGGMHLEGSSITARVEGVSFSGCQGNMGGGIYLELMENPTSILFTNLSFIGGHNVATLGDDYGNMLYIISPDASYLTSEQFRPFLFWYDSADSLSKVKIADSSSITLSDLFRSESIHSFHVSSAGNDDNDCSYEGPCLTMSKVSHLLLPTTDWTYRIFAVSGDTLVAESESVVLNETYEVVFQSSTDSFVKKKVSKVNSDADGLFNILFEETSVQVGGIWFVLSRGDDIIECPMIVVSAGNLELVNVKISPEESSEDSLICLTNALAVVNGRGHCKMELDVESVKIMNKAGIVCGELEAGGSLYLNECHFVNTTVEYGAERCGIIRVSVGNYSDSVEFSDITFEHNESEDHEMCADIYMIGATMDVFTSSTTVQSLVGGSYDHEKEGMYIGSVENSTHSLLFSLIHAKFATNQTFDEDEDDNNVYVIGQKDNERSSSVDMVGCGWRDLPCSSIEYANRNSQSAHGYNIIVVSEDDSRRVTIERGIVMQAKCIRSSEAGEYGRVVMGNGLSNEDVQESGGTGILVNGGELLIEWMDFDVSGIGCETGVDCVFESVNSGCLMSLLNSTIHGCGEGNGIPCSLILLNGGELVLDGMKVSNISFSGKRNTITCESSASLNRNQEEDAQRRITIRNSSFVCILSGCDNEGIGSIIYGGMESCVNVEVNGSEMIGCKNMNGEYGGAVSLFLKENSEVLFVDGSFVNCSCNTTTGWGGWMYLNGADSSLLSRESAILPFVIKNCTFALNAAKYGNDIFIDCQDIGRQITAFQFDIDLSIITESSFAGKSSSSDEIESLLSIISMRNRVYLGKEEELSSELERIQYSQTCGSIRRPCGTLNKGISKLPESADQRTLTVVDDVSISAEMGLRNIILEGAITEGQEDYERVIVNNSMSNEDCGCIISTEENVTIQYVAIVIGSLFSTEHNSLIRGEGDTDSSWLLQIKNVSIKAEAIDASHSFSILQQRGGQVECEAFRLSNLHFTTCAIESNGGTLQIQNSVFRNVSVLSGYVHSCESSKITINSTSFVECKSGSVEDGNGGVLVISGGEGIIYGTQFIGCIDVNGTQNRSVEANERNEGSLVEEICSWNSSSIRLTSSRVSIEDSKFVNFTRGALEISDNCIIELGQTGFITNNPGFSHYPSVRRNIMCMTSSVLDVSSLYAEMGSDSESLWITGDGTCQWKGILQTYSSVFFVPSLSSVTYFRTNQNNYLHFVGSTLIPCSLSYCVFDNNSVLYTSTFLPSNETLTDEIVPNSLDRLLLSTHTSVYVTLTYGELNSYNTTSFLIMDSQLSESVFKQSSLISYARLLLICITVVLFIVFVVTLALLLKPRCCPHKSPPISQQTATRSIEMRSTEKHPAQIGNANNAPIYPPIEQKPSVTNPPVVDSSITSVTYSPSEHLEESGDNFPGYSQDVGIPNHSRSPTEPVVEEILLTNRDPTNNNPFEDAGFPDRIRTPIAPVFEEGELPQLSPILNENEPIQKKKKKKKKKKKGGDGQWMVVSADEML